VLQLAAKITRTVYDIKQMNELRIT